jgi:hypothetical protein
MTDMVRDGSEPTRQRVARRTVLRWALGGSASLMALSPAVTGSVQASDGHTRADVSAEAREQITELARRIRAGEAMVLRDGTVIVDGWYLPAEYVRRIERLG